MRNVTPEQVAMAEQHRRCQSPPHRVARRSRWDGRHLASIRTAGLAKNFGDLRAVNKWRRSKAQTPSKRSEELE